MTNWCTRGVLSTTSRAGSGTLRSSEALLVRRINCGVAGMNAAMAAGAGRA